MDCEILKLDTEKMPVAWVLDVSDETLIIGEYAVEIKGKGKLMLMAEKSITAESREREDDKNA